MWKKTVLVLPGVIIRAHLRGPDRATGQGVSVAGRSLGRATPGTTSPLPKASSATMKPAWVRASPMTAIWKHSPACAPSLRRRCPARSRSRSTPRCDGRGVGHHAHPPAGQGTARALARSGTPAAPARGARAAGAACQDSGVDAVQDAGTTCQQTEAMYRQRAIWDERPVTQQLDLF